MDVIKQEMTNHRVAFETYDGDSEDFILGYEEIKRSSNIRCQAIREL